MYFLKQNPSPQPVKFNKTIAMLEIISHVMTGGFQLFIFSLHCGVVCDCCCQMQFSNTYDEKSHFLIFTVSDFAAATLFNTCS